MLVGIDLGTTHSLIGRYTDQGLELFKNSLGDVLTPSVVAWGDNGGLLVGASARERMAADERLGAHSFKRAMGTDQVFPVGDKRLRAEELSALVLKSLIHDAESSSGEKVTEAVISVPAYFSDAQRKATRAAGEMAGIKVERLVNEPTAAALAYGLLERKEESHFLVLDLGGGTFDVSILETFDGVMEVHASAGDNFLGGEDFLQTLTKLCLKENNLTESDLSKADVGALRFKLERLKKQLSTQNEMAIEFHAGERTLRWSITEQRFAEACSGLLERMRNPLERAMRDAKLKPSELQEIILVGGASRMPMVARLAARMFGRLPLRHINPDQVIALGAVAVAGMKARHQNFKEVVMTDVCPYTLGLEVSERDSSGTLIRGLFSPLINRNSKVPVSREGSYQPIDDNQEVLRLKIFQGESPRVQNNVRLGEIEIGLRRGRAQENSVNVRFTYDVNGLLQVEAKEESTGKVHELIIQQNPGLLSAEEIAERLEALKALKVHPREEQANLATIARAERLFGEHLRARDFIKQRLSEFMGVLEKQDLGHIEQARFEFNKLLDDIEADLGS